MSGRKLTRNSVITPPDVAFPHVEKFSTRLPTYGEVIGVLRKIVEDTKTNIRLRDALNTVANMVYSKYHHDTIYCISFAAILKRIEKDWETFKKGKVRCLSGKTTGSEIKSTTN